MSDDSLKQPMLESAAVMYATYVRSALQTDPHNELTVGFYQWGSLAFYELYTSGWPSTKPYAARTVVMARWALDVQDVANSEGNTANAFEGLAVAWELARLTGDAANQRRIQDGIVKGMNRLMSWQIGLPTADGKAVPKAFLRSPRAAGGVVIAPGVPQVRIDIVQHQMHATMLTRDFLFKRATQGTAHAPVPRATSQPSAKKAPLPGPLPARGERE
jgi:hypothetical protein